MFRSNTIPTRYCVMLCCILLAVSTGCSTRLSNKDIGESIQHKLERNHIVYVAVPEDGMYATQKYAGSGMQVASFLKNSLSSYNKQCVLGARAESQQQTLSAAAAAQAKYAFIPVITHWEPRAAAWSGRATRVTLTISIYDVAASQLLLTRQIGADGRVVTFVSQHAHDLAEKSIQAFIESIY